MHPKCSSSVRLRPLTLAPACISRLTAAAVPLELACPFGVLLCSEAPLLAAPGARSNLHAVYILHSR